MPIKIQDGLPAIEVLAKENIFVMTESRAAHQDIRPLRLLILNLMPLKITTENQLIRLLSNSPLQVEVELIRTKSYMSKTTSQDHLESFYKTFDEVKNKKFDGLIITGAPVENMEFEEVDYWQEMTEIMDWSTHNVTSTLHICWAAQAGLYYHYDVPKHPVTNKVSGVFYHKIMAAQIPLVRGFDDVFLAPHSRHTEVRLSDVEGIEDLLVAARSDVAGLYMLLDHAGKNIFVTGHSEYDPLTLKREYERDLDKGLNPQIPQNYFPQDDPAQIPKNSWRSHAHLLFSNWLNYYVYQSTPFNLEDIN
ncbi:MAG: homoserine O-succinyltransferase [Spirochaetaceae bacterium]|jgi:homoserine O-succinyltransferase|nr:homoserine O-succinyltransferase [Spirochaetaceae bacterium]